jgi:hypothetical protein
MLKFLNENTGAITTISTIILTVTTMVYAWLTAILARENKLLRRAGTEPEMVAYLTPHQHYNLAYQFVIANVGQGPAFDIFCRITRGGDDFAAHEARLHTSAIPLTVMPQGERYETFFGMGWQLLKEPRLRPFMVEVQYRDLKNKKHIRTFEIDFSQFEGRIMLGGRPDEKMADALKSISDELRGWTRGHLPVETITRQEREQRDKALRDELLATAKNSTGSPSG